MGLTFAQRLLKSTVDRYLSPKEGKTTTISLPLFSGLWATLQSHTASGNSSGQHLNFAILQGSSPPKSSAAETLIVITPQSNLHFDSLIALEQNLCSPIYWPFCTQKAAGGTHRMAAATAAPDEMPHRRPSSSASRRAIMTLSLDEMAITSSIMSRFRTSGMNPAPMPWICIRHSIQTHQP